MLGRTIRIMREDKGLTKTQFASMVGITRSGLTLIEQGKRKPWQTTLVKIAEALGVSVEELQSKKFEE